MNIGIYEDVIDDVDCYVDSIIDEGFEDIRVGDDLFKSVKIRGVDKLVMFLLNNYPNYIPDLNFVRRSPLNQDEPNWIHTDEMMGDLTAILYLNEEHPDNDGTTIYYKGKESCVLKARYNRLVVFDSDLYHSRNIYENFGEGEYSRLVQVMFLKLKK